MLITLLACTLTTKEPELTGFPSTITLSLEKAESVPSVILAKVESENPTDFFIQVQSDGKSFTSQTFNTATDTSVPIIGVPPGAMATVTAQTQNTERIDFAQAEIQTGALSSIFGDLRFDVLTNDFQEGYWLVSLFNQEQTLALILDMNGTILWGVRQGDDNNGGVDIQLDPSGDSFWMNTFPTEADRSATKLHQVALDGQIIDSIDVPNAHHLFDIPTSGSFVWLSYDLRNTELYGNVCGDLLMKTDGSGDEIVFTVWDWLTLYESGSWNFGIPLDCRDWTHGNGILYDHNRQSYLMSFAGADLIMEIGLDGIPQQILGGLSAQDNDYTYDNWSDAFSYPHGVSWGPNGEILVLSTVDNVTEAAAYMVEDDVIYKTWSFGSEYGHRALNLGEVAQMTETHRLINWGSVGRLQVVDSSDAVVFDMQTELGYWFAEVEYLPNLPLMNP
ncbi:MAG: aryl-sulfate sulfotransferase [Myxococcota bacterium]